MAEPIIERVITVTTASGSMQTIEDLHVVEIRWVKPTTVGHDCVIQNNAGDVLWASTATVANDVEKDGSRRLWPGGFKVPTLGSGTLYIGLGRK